MEKKIIGYKTPFDINAKILKGTVYVKESCNYCPQGKEGTGSEWYLPPQIVEQWEPVYKQEEFTVGDWVTVVKYIDEDSLGRSHYKIGETFCINDIYESQFSHIYKWVKSNSKPTCEISINSLRLATPEEIKAAQTPQITINGYKGEFFDDYVRFGCAKIDKQDFIDLDKLAIRSNITNKKLTSVCFGIGTFTREQIKEIVEYYLNKK